MYNFVKVNLKDETHYQALVSLLNEYMKDEMGAGKPMSAELKADLIDGLKQHAAYAGFFASVGDEFIALANCNLNFSTWEAKPLINIHDFIVHPDHRGRGAGMFLLDKIAGYALQNGFCRINLEVRHDNIKAQKLYKKAGFHECSPPNYFWEKQLLK